MLATDGFYKAPSAQRQKLGKLAHSDVVDDAWRHSKDCVEVVGFSSWLGLVKASATRAVTFLRLLRARLRPSSGACVECELRQV
eukprot:1139309-Amphidinium_carterae.1